MASVDIEAARAKLTEEMKVDVLTELQEADNEKARKGVSRSFICMSSKSSVIYKCAYVSCSGHDNRFVFMTCIQK